MTNKEIIKEIKCILEELSYEDAVSYLTQNDKTWLEENIKALEQETCEDAISRQAVLDKKELVELEDGQSFYCINPEDVETLPSVIPQQKTGYWIPCSERLPKTADVYRVTRYYPNNVMNPEYLVDACLFDGSNTWYDDNRINHERAYADNVIAWQENPEPYRPESEEEE